jgi:hypothetical protein
MMQISFNSLNDFFTNWQTINSSVEKIGFAENISQFFQKFSEFHQQETPGKIAPRVTQKTIDTQDLAKLFTTLEKPLQASRYSAISFDPLRLMKLGRDEVRVVSLLSWLLNPYGSHGYGPVLLQGFLAYIHQYIPSFPTFADSRCQVRTEINLNGESDSRADIEIDFDHFYIIIEAKVDALEQPRQVERYCEQARKRTKQNCIPWAIIYLTPSGKKPSHEDRNLVCLSWYQLSHTLQKSMIIHQNHRKNYLPSVQDHADFFIKTYLNHIRSL